MPVAGQVALSKGEVMMYLDIATLNRTVAARLADVSRATFFRAMNTHRVRAPKPQAKLTTKSVKEIKAHIEKKELSRCAIAKMYHVHERTIIQIEERETWYWV